MRAATGVRERPISLAVRRAAFDWWTTGYLGGSSYVPEKKLGALVELIRAEILEEQTRSADFLAGLRVVERDDVPPNEVWLSVADKRVATITNINPAAAPETETRT